MFRLLRDRSQAAEFDRRSRLRQRSVGCGAAKARHRDDRAASEQPKQAAHARSAKVKPLHATLARRALLRLDSMAAPDPHSLGVPRPQFPRLCPACLPPYSLQTILRRVLVNPTASVLAEPQKREVLSAAQALGIKLHVLNASVEQDFDRIFAKLTELGAGGLVIGGDAFFPSHAKQLAGLTVQHAVPAIYQWREFAAAGGLMSYRANVTETHRLVGIYAGRILKGGRRAALPVQQAAKVEMFINLKTARALGITIPLPLSGRADEIFE